MILKNCIKIIVAVTLFTALLSIVPSASAETVVSFNYTGSVQTWEVPSGVTEIEIEAWGAQGGSDDYNDNGNWGYGGKGGYAYGKLSVSAGQELKIYVGEEGAETGAGGYNGGGASGTHTSSGGGASDVRTGSYTLNDRVIVAGGGGGATHGSYPQDGGAGGGLTGEDGVDYGSYYAGHGGTQTEGGAAGTGFSGTEAGSFGEGGGTGSFHNAGGGGGWYGGGSGAGHASAAGGSSYIGGVTEGTTTSDVRSGDGLVTITYTVSSNSAPTASFTTDETLYINEETTFNASDSTDSDGSITNYSWDWTNDGTYDDHGVIQTHTYTETGYVNITLRVTDNEGATDIQTQQKYIYSEPSPPVPEAQTFILFGLGTLIFIGMITIKRRKK